MLGIKGMDVPKNCLACPLCLKEYFEFYCIGKTGVFKGPEPITRGDVLSGKRPAWCPAVDVPEPARD